MYSTAVLLLFFFKYVYTKDWAKVTLSHIIRDDHKESWTSLDRSSRSINPIFRQHYMILANVMLLHNWVSITVNNRMDLNSWYTVRRHRSFPSYSHNDPHSHSDWAKVTQQAPIDSNTTLSWSRRKKLNQIDVLITHHPFLNILLQPSWVYPGAQEMDF